MASRDTCRRCRARLSGLARVTETRDARAPRNPEQVTVGVAVGVRRGGQFSAQRVTIELGLDRALPGERAGPFVACDGADDCRAEVALVDLAAETHAAEGRQKDNAGCALRNNLHVIAALRKDDLPV